MLVKVWMKTNIRNKFRIDHKLEPQKVSLISLCVSWTILNFFPLFYCLFWQFSSFFLIFLWFIVYLDSFLHNFCLFYCPFWHFIICVLLCRLYLSLFCIFSLFFFMALTTLKFKLYSHTSDYITLKPKQFNPNIHDLTP